MVFWLGVPTRVLNVSSHQDRLSLLLRSLGHAKKLLLRLVLTHSHVASSLG